MKQELLNEFKVEELEQRYEMGRWIDSVKVGYNDNNVEINGTFDIE